MCVCVLSWLLEFGFYSGREQGWGDGGSVMASERMMAVRVVEMFGFAIGT